MLSPILSDYNRINSQVSSSVPAELLQVPWYSWMIHQLRNVPLFCKLLFWCRCKFKVLPMVPKCNISTILSGRKERSNPIQEERFNILKRKNISTEIIWFIISFQLLTTACIICWSFSIVAFWQGYVKQSMSQMVAGYFCYKRWMHNGYHLCKLK